MQQATNVVDDFVLSVTETGRYICPACSHQRKPHNQRKPELRVTLESNQILYYCHHCGIDGSVQISSRPIADRYYQPPKPKKPTVTYLPTPLNNSQQIINNFFASRGVDTSELDFNGHVVTDRQYFGKLGKEADAVGFLYGTEDNVQAIKWRPANPKEKSFTQTGAARMFYGLRPMEENEKSIIVVEGEADVIALASVGIEAWSVPNGASMKVSKGRIDPEEDTKFSYVWDAWEQLQSAERIVLATDNDTQGVALKEELARRIGLEKCWEVQFPEDTKDPTDVLKDMGSDALKNVFTAAKPMPLKGIYDVDSYFEQVEYLYREGIPSGISTGLESVDELFKVKEGMLYIVTGFPGCGKSEFIDQIMINTAMNNHWKWGVASFENPPDQHIPKFMEKYTGMPFFEGRSQRMSREQLNESKEFLDEHFVFLEQKDGSMATIEDIIARLKLAIARCGCRGAVIDPYNYINMSHYEAEHIGISVMLSELSAFARAHGIAIFFVAHPQKVFPNADGSMPIPKGSHIPGSAAWWAKADIGFTVHRDKDDNVEVHCWKARFKWLGQIGDRQIGYNIINGVYSNIEQTSQRSKWYRPSRDDKEKWMKKHTKPKKEAWKNEDIPF